MTYSVCHTKLPQKVLWTVYYVMNLQEWRISQDYLQIKRCQKLNSTKSGVQSKEDKGSEIMTRDMKKFVFDVIGSEEGMKAKMIAEFRSFKNQEGLKEEDIREFVKIIFSHSFDTGGNSKFKNELSEFLGKLVD